MHQLDGLRTLAVGCVMWFHIFPTGQHFWGISFGDMGVQLFFVLSGFLITGILLDARSQADAIGDQWHMMSHFYARRALRLLPLLYAVIAILVLLDARPISDTWPWHVFYLTNVYQWLYGWAGWGSHLWSLSVEEQFYLCWPLLVLFVPRRAICPTILSLIFLAPLFRYLTWEAGSLGDPNRLPFGVLDSLGLGAFMAYVIRYSDTFAPSKVASALLIVGVCGICGIRYLGVGLALNQTLLSCVFAWLVWKGSLGFKGAIGRFLVWSPIQYIGKISYGVYVIQGFAGFFWLWWLYQAPVPGYRIFARLNISEGVYTNQVVTHLASICITFGLAALSWHFLEVPMNGLRKYFPYSRRALESGSTEHSIKVPVRAQPD